MVLAGANSLDLSCSIIQVEAWGLSEGFEAARYFNIENAIIKGDNLLVINLISNIWKPPWIINSMTVDAGRDLHRSRPEPIPTGRVDWNHHIFCTGDQTRFFRLGVQNCTGKIKSSLSPGLYEPVL